MLAGFFRSGGEDGRDGNFAPDAIGRLERKTLGQQNGFTRSRNGFGQIFDVVVVVVVVMASSCIRIVEWVVVVFHLNWWR